MDLNRTTVDLFQDTPCPVACTVGPRRNVAFRVAGTGTRTGRDRDRNDRSIPEPMPTLKTPRNGQNLKRHHSHLPIPNSNSLHPAVCSLTSERDRQRQAGPQVPSSQRALARHATTRLQVLGPLPTGDSCLWCLIRTASACDQPIADAKGPRKGQQNTGNATGRARLVVCGQKHDRVVEHARKL